MRIHAISDIHVDYAANAKWIANLSRADFSEDTLILAGDVADSIQLLAWCLGELTRRFKTVLFVPGNHDVWVHRDVEPKDSMQKFRDVVRAVDASGASMQPFIEPRVAIIPVLGWYDYSFGQPAAELRSVWMDYHACRWPEGFGEDRVAAYFDALNGANSAPVADVVITFSHFLPRIDVMPSTIPARYRYLYPILGSNLLERQVRRLGAHVHVYGHSHVNRHIEIDGVTYINNAFGYPQETSISSKGLRCIYTT